MDWTLTLETGVSVGSVQQSFREHLQLRTEVSLFLCFQELQARSPTWTYGVIGGAAGSFGSKRQEVTFVMDVVPVTNASTLS